MNTHVAIGLIYAFVCFSIAILSFFLIFVPEKI